MASWGSSACEKSGERGVRAWATWTTPKTTRNSVPSVSFAQATIGVPMLRLQRDEFDRPLGAIAKKIASGIGDDIVGDGIEGICYRVDCRVGKARQRHVSRIDEFGLTAPLVGDGLGEIACRQREGTLLRCLDRPAIEQHTERR